MKLLFRRWSMTSREYQRHDNGLQLLESMQDGQTLIDRLHYYESEVYENEDGIVVDHYGCEVYDKGYPNVAKFDDYKYYVVHEDDLSRAEERLLSMNQYVEVVIDEGYTATIRDLDSLRDYLSRETSLSPLFGIIKHQSSIMTQGFIDEFFEIIKDHKEMFAENDDRIGKRIWIERNQGRRLGIIVSYVGSDIMVEYYMPQGNTYLNVIKSDGSYKSYSYKKLSKSKKWRKNLADNLLINNPQSGKKFKK